MVRTHQGRRTRAPTPAVDIEAIANEAFVYVPDENCWNQPREAKHQLNLLREYFDHIGALAGQESISDMTRTNPGDIKDWHLLDLFRTQLFQELLFKLVFHQRP